MCKARVIEMNRTPGMLIPVEEIRRLTSGSFEHKISQIDAAVQEDKKRIFGESVAEVKVVGSYPTHAVVASDSGEFARVRLEAAEDGSLKVVQHELLKVESIGPEKMDSFLESESNGIVDLYLRGRVEEAKSRLAGLVPLVLAHSKKAPEVQVEEKVAAPSTWKVMYEQKSAVIKGLLEEDMDLLTAARLNTKFRKLSDGTIAEAKVPGYKELVLSDLKYLSTRLEALSDLVEQAFVEADGKAQELSENGEASLVGTFKEFGEDLIRDLRKTYTALQEDTKNVKDVRLLGKLYDTLAEELFDYEVAGHFVNRMARRLVSEAA